MTKPRRLLLVRHGRSQGNEVHHWGAKGDMRGYTDEFEQMLSSHYRLTAEGREQAVKTGEWLKDHGLGTFGRYYVSSYVRAAETAGLLDLDDAEWFEDHRLREVEHGEMDKLPRAVQQARFPEVMQHLKEDAFHAIPPNGESIAQLTDRLRSLIATLEEECSDDDVILVCHSEVMWAFVQVLEKMPIADWLKLVSSKDSFHRIHNCQIIEYTRENPYTGKLSPDLSWVRWVCPWDESLSRGTWKEIIRPRYSNKELLELAEKYPYLPEL